MTKTKATIYSVLFLLLFIGIPFFVIERNILISGGWNGLPWGATESQAKEWVQKNNTNALWNKCKQNHFGVSCYKVTWKDNANVPFESIEFQFKNGELCAVKETKLQTQIDPAISMKLGNPTSGKDLANDIYKEKGIKYKLTDRIFFYKPERQPRNVKITYSVERLVRTNISDLDMPDLTLFYQLSIFYTAPEYSSQEQENALPKFL